MMNRVPCPTALSTSMSPPIWWMIPKHMDNPSPLPLAHRFGGEKRIEYAVQVGCGNTGAGVGHGDHCLVAVTSAPDGKDAALGFHGLYGIVDEIEKDLLQFGCRGRNTRHGFVQFKVEIHLGVPCRLHGEVDHFTDKSGQVHAGYA